VRRALYGWCVIGGVAAAAVSGGWAGGSSIAQTAQSLRANRTTVQPAASGPLNTGLTDPWAFSDSEAQNALKRTARSVGASFVRLAVFWSGIAPSARPPGFDPANPGDPAYNWSFVDAQVSRAVAAGLQPILQIMTAPVWAEGEAPGREGVRDPDPEQFGLFAEAAARRYRGDFNSLPRVRYWQAWNEPNISLFLTPQFRDKTPYSPDLYRRMVNDFADAVHGVHPDNVVIAGGTAPFRDITGVVLQVDRAWGPLSFMRRLLCLSPSLQATCHDKVHFDVWGHDPYTSGGPTHHALLPDDVSVPDLPKMRAVLAAAARNGTIVSGRPIGFWAMEFSWASKPPSSGGVPAALEARWTAEALYRMWASGVSLVTWFLLRDQPPATNFYQTGLYYSGANLAADRPKPALEAFRFPVVGLPKPGGKVLLWGRTPRAKPVQVLLERRLGGGWQKLATMRTDRYGIFQRTFAIPAVGYVRATLVSTGERARPFGLRPVPDHFYNPFGQPTILETPK
jgi:hypothetical protein